MFSPEENQDDCGPSSGDNGPGKRKARKVKADADSESSSDSSSSCVEDPPRKSRGKKGTTESRDIAGVKRDSNTPGEFELGEDEKQELAQGLSRVKDRYNRNLKDPQVSAMFQDINNFHSAGTTFLVTSPPESGHVFVGRNIQNFTSTGSSKELHHIFRDGVTGGKGSLVHNLYGEVKIAGKYISSTGGMDQANSAMKMGIRQESQMTDESLPGKSSSFKSSFDASHMTESDPRGTFTMPTGEDQTYLNVFNGDAEINRMATVVQQDGTSDTTGDTFLKNTKANQYDVAVQTVPGARGNTVGSEINGYFEADKVSVSVSSDLPEDDSGLDAFNISFFKKK